MQQSKVSFAHIRTNHLHGGVTLAYVNNPDNTINLAFAFCSDTERYTKRVGREISRNRLNSGKHVVLNNSDVPAKNATRSSDLIEYVIANLDTFKAKVTKPYKSKV